MNFSNCQAEGKGKKGGGGKEHLAGPPKATLQKGLEKIKVKASWATLFPQVFCPSLQTLLAPFLLLALWGAGEAVKESLLFMVEGSHQRVITAWAPVTDSENQTDCAGGGS